MTNNRIRNTVLQNTHGQTKLMDGIYVYIYVCLRGRDCENDEIKLFGVVPYTHVYRIKKEMRRREIKYAVWVEEVITMSRYLSLLIEYFYL